MIIKYINKREALRMFPGTRLTLVIVNAILPTGAGVHGKVPAPSTFSQARTRRHFPRNGWSGRDTHPSYLKGSDDIMKLFLMAFRLWSSLGRLNLKSKASLKSRPALCCNTTAAVSGCFEVLSSVLCKALVPEAQLLHKSLTISGWLRPGKRRQSSSQISYVKKAS